MCCERLVCAHCAGPVVAAGCSVCRAARAELHGASGPSYLTLVALLLAALAVVAALQAVLTR